MSRGSRVLLVAALAAPIVVLGPVSPAMALNVVAVTTTSDVVNGGDGVVSLREAFTIANSDGDDTQITLVADALYRLCNLVDHGDRRGRQHRRRPRSHRRQRTDDHRQRCRDPHGLSRRARRPPREHWRLDRARRLARRRQRPVLGEPRSLSRRSPTTARSVAVSLGRSTRRSTGRHRQRDSATHRGSFVGNQGAAVTDSISMAAATITNVTRSREHTGYHRHRRSVLGHRLARARQLGLSASATRATRRPACP